MLKKKSFDVIVCVYNSPRNLRWCLSSIFDCGKIDTFNVIIVDDFSDDVTKNIIQEFATKYPKDVLVISNQLNMGYVKSANEGIKNSVSDNVVFVNSDVIVTKNWLEKFHSALKNDPKIGLISAVSNNAANLTIKMLPGFDFIKMNHFVETTSKKLYPDAMTVVGHCMLVTRSVIDKCGLFDEAYSPAYTEETDYHFKAINNGFRAVIADDTYVYHKGEGSIKNRNILLEQHLQIFRERWGKQFDQLISKYDALDALGYLRDKQTLLPLIDKYRHRAVYDVIFVLPGLVAGIGGISTVVEIVNGLIRHGVSANIAYLGNKSTDLELIFEPLQYDSYEQLEKFPPDTKVLVATEYGTVDVVSKITTKYKTKSAYFIQDYEGWFDPIQLFELVKRGYMKIENKIVVSNWLHKMLIEQDNQTNTVLNVGVPTELFYSRPLSKDDYYFNDLEDLRKRCKIIVGSLLSQNERRGSVFFIQAMRELLKETDDIGFVVTQRTKAFEGDTIHDRIISLEMVNYNKMPSYFSYCDILVDCSLYHGFGLPGLEAMSCGLTGILTDVELEYAQNNYNCILVKPKNIAQLKQAILELRDNQNLLKRLKENARKTSLEYDWEKLIPKYVQYFKSLLDSTNKQEIKPNYNNLLKHKNILKVIETRTLGVQPINYSKNIATPKEVFSIFRFYVKQHGFYSTMKECWNWIFK